MEPIREIEYTVSSNPTSLVDVEEIMREIARVNKEPYALDRYALGNYLIQMDQDFFTDWKPLERGFLDTLPLTLGPRLCAAVRHSGYEEKRPQKKKAPVVLVHGYYCVDAWVATQQSDRLIPYTVRGEANATSFWITVESPTHLFKYTNGRVEVRSRDGKILMERWDQSAGFILSGEFHKTFERRILRTTIKQCPGTVGAFVRWMTAYTDDLIKNSPDMDNNNGWMESAYMFNPVVEDKESQVIDQEVADIYEDCMTFAKVPRLHDEIEQMFIRLEKFALARGFIKAEDDELPDFDET